MRSGVWLLPPFYVAYLLALLLLCHDPANGAWLTTGGAALSVAMAFWALVFGVGSVERKRPAPREPGEAPMETPAAWPSETKALARIAQMPTRQCRQPCTLPSGAAAQFSIACYEAGCTGSAHPPSYAPKAH
jgi:hypothetical protein